MTGANKKSHKKTGKKGFETEELVRNYFIGAGFFVVRGVRVLHGGDDLTDIDLWLYERSATLARRRIIIDIKDNAHPKAAERMFFVKGLAETIQVEAVGVVTSDSRSSIKELARKHNVIWINNADIQRLKSSKSLAGSRRITDEQLREKIADLDRTRSSKNLNDIFGFVKSSVADRFGASSANTALDGTLYFASRCLESFPNSEAAETLTRLSYFCTAIAAAALDFVSGETALRSMPERYSHISDAIRYGDDPKGFQDKLQWAQAAIRENVGNGAGIAETIGLKMTESLNALPVEDLAQIVTKMTASERLFDAAKALESAAFAIRCPSFDDLDINAKAFLGAVLDFSEINRSAFAERFNGSIATSNMSVIPTKLI